MTEIDQSAETLAARLEALKNAAAHRRDVMKMPSPPASAEMLRASHKAVDDVVDEIDFADSATIVRRMIEKEETLSAERDMLIKTNFSNREAHHKAITEELRAIQAGYATLIKSSDFLMEASQNLVDKCEELRTERQALREGLKQLLAQVRASGGAALSEACDTAESLL